MMGDFLPEWEGNGETSPYPKCTIAALKAYQQYCAPVSRVNRIGLLQMVGAGHLVRTVNHEFQYGTQYLWPRRPAVNLLSVAAGDVHTWC